MTIEPDFFATITFPHCLSPRNTEVDVLQHAKIGKDLYQCTSTSIYFHNSVPGLDVRVQNAGGFTKDTCIQCRDIELAPDPEGMFGIIICF